MKLYQPIKQINAITFKSLYMTHYIDYMDGSGLNNTAIIPKVPAKGGKGSTVLINHFSSIYHTKAAKYIHGQPLQPVV